MSATMIRQNQATIDATSGYGNTNDSKTATESRILDNNICNGDLRSVLSAILTARFGSELPAIVAKCEWATVSVPIIAGEVTRPITSKEMNAALQAVMHSWASNAANYYRGWDCATGVLTGLLLGPLERCIPACAGWITAMLPKRKSA